MINTWRTACSFAIGIITAVVIYNHSELYLIPIVILAINWRWVAEAADDIFEDVQRYRESKKMARSFKD